MLLNIVSYFSEIPSLHRAIILAGGLGLFWIIEACFPLFSKRYKYLRHAWPNLFFTLTTVIVNFAFAYIILVASDSMVKKGNGLLHQFTMPLWLFIVVGFMLLDFISAYFIHYIQHKVKWMWKFHLVHHSDMHVDATTANRHHPVESIFRAIFTLIAVIVTGAPMWLIMMYQSVSVMFSQFNHANIRLPHRLDYILSWVIISPNMHKIHHHYLQPLTDTNYGNIFSIWDRIFKTYAKVGDTEKDIQYGIDLMMSNKESQSIYTLMQMPFRKYDPLPTSKFVAEKNGTNKDAPL